MIYGWLDQYGSYIETGVYNHIEFAVENFLTHPSLTDYDELFFYMLYQDYARIVQECGILHCQYWQKNDMTAYCIKFAEKHNLFFKPEKMNISKLLLNKFRRLDNGMEQFN